MSTHLRLHTEWLDEQAAPGAASCLPATYRFPEAMAAARRSLVAGVVQVPAVPEPARGGCNVNVVAKIGPGGVLTPQSETDRLLRGVEQTLEDMQRKLDALREDAEDAFKFPEIEDEGPRAA